MPCNKGMSQSMILLNNLGIMTENNILIADSISDKGEFSLMCRSGFVAPI